MTEPPADFGTDEISKAMASQMTAQQEIDALKTELAKFHEAMECEKGPKWSAELKALAWTLEHSAHYQVIPVSPEDLRKAARQLRYMADCFTHKANFVPSELRIKELEGERELDKRVHKEALEKARVALTTLKTKNHADNDRGHRTCLGHECKACDTIDDALRHINEVLK